MNGGESKLLHGETTEAILGAFFSVHAELGVGFLESVYANALSVALRQAGFSVVREAPFEIYFRGVLIGRYRADMVVDSKVVVEVKTTRSIEAAHTAQLLNYLRASGLHVGLVLSFARTCDFRRVICEQTQRPSASHTA